MATVNFSIPDDVKASFNATFRDQNRSAVIAELMREAVERVQRHKRSNEAIDRILSRHAHAPMLSDKKIHTSRKSGRP